MPAPKPLEYNYSQTGPAWDHSIVFPYVSKTLESLPASASVLDLGCGNGAMLTEMHKLGSWRLAGVESSQSAVTLAQSQGLDVTLADATNSVTALFDPHSFDLVICVEVIEHVYDPRGLLEQARTLLRPNGRLLITTPYHGYLKNLMIAVSGHSDAHYNPLWDCGHIKFWSRKTLTGALLETGYKDVEFHGAGRIPYLWKSMVLIAHAA